MIETYKGLQQDPTSTMIQLLTRIATNLEAPANNQNVTSSQISSPPFTPTAITVRINALFFVSLILSLISVIIGIISLQWLREHRAYSRSLTPQNAFATFNMRSEALKRWRVPEIISTLPLLLQLALVLFFIGICEFLGSINTDVAIPVITCVGTTFLFLILTTTLPTLQAFPLRLSFLKMNDNVPNPCPYKSPQSRAFRHFITSSEVVFSVTSIVFAIFYWVLIQLAGYVGSFKAAMKNLYIRSQVQDTIWHSLSHLNLAQHLSFLQTSRMVWPEFDYMTSKIFDYWRTRSSLEFDVRWLSIRDNYYQSVRPKGSWLHRMRFDHENLGAVYDDTRGIRRELDKKDVNINSELDSSMFTIYHCKTHNLFPFPRLPEIEDINDICTENQYLTTLLGHEKSTPSSLFPHLVSALPLLADERALILLYEFHLDLDELRIGSSIVSKHFCEVYFRLLGNLYSQPRHLISPDGPEEEIPKVIIAAADTLYKVMGDISDSEFQRELQFETLPISSLKSSNC